MWATNDLQHILTTIATDQRQTALEGAGGSTSDGGFEAHVDHRDEWRLKEYYQKDTDEVYRR